MSDAGPTPSGPQPASVPDPAAVAPATPPSPGQAYPEPGAHPAQAPSPEPASYGGYAAPAGQPYPSQSYPSQPYPGQGALPGQVPYPGQPYPGQSYPGQAGYPAQAPYTQYPPQAGYPQQGGYPAPYGAVQYASPKNLLVATLLCFFLGVLGVHRFYAGKVGTGVLQLLTGGGLGIWTLVDFIMLVCQAFKDSDGYTLRWDTVR